MSGELVRFPGSRLLLPMRYAGSIGYWAMLASAESVTIDAAMRFNKRQKDTHRTEICDTHGLLRLTVPITLPDNIHSRELRWSDVKVSAHGHWWNIHLTALESAYGRTPYFQFYIDRFRPFFAPRYADSIITLHELNRGIDGQISDILGIPSPIYNIDEPIRADESQTDVYDYRNRRPVPMAPVEYYQVRSDVHGFMPDLSILDLIFNMGPESPLVLRKMIRALKEL